MTVIAADRPSHPRPVPGARESRPWRAHVLAVVAGLFVTGLAGLLLIVGAITVFRARRLYAGIARYGAIVVLAMYGIRVRLHQAQPLPRTQTIYISNHSSTLDLFVLVALGLPNCRFFLSGFLRKYIPLGVIAWMMGTFFTVPQDRPAERVRIFQRADRTLRRTRESVYLSPEGGRITGGRIGHFNKGAFHLATSLQVPIVPLYFDIPRDIDPGRGYDARPGTVDVYVLPTIDTREWTLTDVAAHAARTRELYVQAASTSCPGAFCQ
jgi:putative phosphoserine phosphatase/1-acylglycerol-3-phosphate O-acyltransferase